jgi:thioredoxin-related protein
MKKEFKENEFQHGGIIPGDVDLTKLLSYDHWYYVGEKMKKEFHTNKELKRIIVDNIYDIQLEFSKEELEKVKRIKIDKSCKV